MMPSLITLVVALALLFSHALAGLPVKIDPSKLHNINNILFQSKTVWIKDPVTTNGRNLSFVVPSINNIFAPSTSWQDATANYLKANLPTTLQQFNVPSDQIPGKVDKAIPLMIELAQGFFVEPTAKLRKRNIFGDILDWAADAGCALVAATGYGAYMILAADYAAANNGDGTSLTHDQDFFLTASHSTLGHDGPVNIYYNAQQFPWVSRPGITFNRQVYLDTPQVSEYGTQDWAPFASLIHLLIHEFTHVEQYRARGYDLTTFAHEYIFQLCRDGFSYDKIPLEMEAKGRETEVDDLLLPWKPGNKFFWIWKLANLFPQIGNAVDRASSQPNPSLPLLQLGFQNGLIEIQDPNVNPPNFRVFSASEVHARAAANCNPNPPCWDNRRRRSPMPPGGPVIKPHPCTKQEKEELAQACRNAKTAWKTIADNRPWRNDITIPNVGTTPAAPSGGGTSTKPGCPPQCSIITLVPLTSKSCSFENPPEGCDHVFANQNNKECKQKQQACK